MQLFIVIVVVAVVTVKCIYTFTYYYCYCVDDDEEMEEFVEEVEIENQDSTASFVCPRLFDVAAKASEAADLADKQAAGDVARRSTSVRRSRFVSVLKDYNAAGDELVRYGGVILARKNKTRCRGTPSADMICGHPSSRTASQASTA